MAAVHRALRDDLRRPRDHRRLEHLVRVAPGHARPAVVERADLLRARVVLGVPACREPRPGGPRGRSRLPAAPPDAHAELMAFAAAADSSVDDLADGEVDAPEDTGRGYRWSFSFDIGRTRIAVLDNRGARVLTARARAMLSPPEWSWFADLA